MKTYCIHFLTTGPEALIVIATADSGLAAVEAAKKQLHQLAKAGELDAIHYEHVVLVRADQLPS